jgi:hypothetical protein
VSEQITPAVLSARDARARWVELSARLDSKKATPEDRTALARLYDDAPWLWQLYGDLARYALDELLGSLNASTAVRKAIGRKIDHMRDELGYKDAPQLERSLIEQICITWLRLQAAEIIFTAVVHAKDGCTLTKAEHEEKMLASAQARHLRAVEALARVRRLAQRTPLQVNIGAQQVNVAGEAVATVATQKKTGPADP